MLDFLFGPRQISRRDCLRLGGLAVGGLTLADVLRQRAAADPGHTRSKSVIMVYLPGGPSHLDMYDMKPEAPAEYRGEFSPIRTNVPGMHICELMPRQAVLADKFAIVRGLVTRGNHDPTELLTGIHAEASGQIGAVRRPALGCVVSKLREGAGPMPPYVSTSSHRLLNSYGPPDFDGQNRRDHRGARRRDRRRRRRFVAARRFSVRSSAKWPSRHNVGGPGRLKAQRTRPAQARHGFRPRRLSPRPGQISANARREAGL